MGEAEAQRGDLVLSAKAKALSGSTLLCFGLPGQDFRALHVAASLCFGLPCLPHTISFFNSARCLGTAVFASSFASYSRAT